MHIISTARPELTREIDDCISRPYYEAGEAYMYLAKEAGTATVTHSLAGKLYLASSGWLMLSVPNALVRGAFDALNQAGAELPPGKDGGPFTAHVTVADPDDVKKMGGPDKISERGHQYSYTLGPVKECEPTSWGEMSKCWFITVHSPELQNLRKSYGLSPRPKDNEQDFHITIAVRRKHVLRNNDVKKAAEVLSVLPAKLASLLNPSPAASRFNAWRQKKRVVLPPAPNTMADERMSTVQSMKEAVALIKATVQPPLAQGVITKAPQLAGAQSHIGGTTKLEPPPVKTANSLIPGLETNAIDKHVTDLMSKYISIFHRKNEQ